MMRHRRFLTGVMMVVLIALFALASAMPAAATEVWRQKFSRFSATAGETLAIGDVVCIKAADGYVYKADSNDSDLRPAVGAIGKGGASGAKVEIVTEGDPGRPDKTDTGYPVMVIRDCRRDDGDAADQCPGRRVGAARRGHTYLFGPLLHPGDHPQFRGGGLLMGAARKILLFSIPGLMFCIVPIHGISLRLCLAARRHLAGGGLCHTVFVFRLAPGVLRFGAGAGGDDEQRGAGVLHYAADDHHRHADHRGIPPDERPAGDGHGGPGLAAADRLGRFAGRRCVARVCAGTAGRAVQH